MKTRFSLKYFVTGCSVWIFPVSETGSTCNSLFNHADSNWIIIMELKRKVEYS